MTSAAQYVAGSDSGITLDGMETDLDDDHSCKTEDTSLDLTYTSSFGISPMLVVKQEEMVDNKQLDEDETRPIFGRACVGGRAAYRFSTTKGCYEVDEKALKLSVLKAELIAAELHRPEEATAPTKILNEYTKQLRRFH